MTAEELIKLLSELDPKTRVVVLSRSANDKTAEVGTVFSGNLSVFGEEFPVVFLQDGMDDLPFDIYAFRDLAIIRESSDSLED